MKCGDCDNKFSNPRCTENSKREEKEEENNIKKQLSATIVAEEGIEFPNVKRKRKRKRKRKKMRRPKSHI